MYILKQAWWAPLAAVLVIALLLVAQAFLLGDGTSNALDAESTAAGATLSLAGVISLVAGLLLRPRARGLGSALVILGAALASIWIWTVLMTPIALVLIVGVVLSYLRPPVPA